MTIREYEVREPAAGSADGALTDQADGAELFVAQLVADRFSQRVELARLSLG